VGINAANTLLIFYLFIFGGIGIWTQGLKHKLFEKEIPIEIFRYFLTMERHSTTWSTLRTLHSPFFLIILLAYNTCAGEYIVIFTYVLILYLS
jgi:predicted membrane protein